MLTAVAGLHSDAALAARAAGRVWLAGDSAAVGLVAQCYRAVRERAAGRSGPTPVAGRPRCGGPHKKKNVLFATDSSRAQPAGPGSASDSDAMPLCQCKVRALAD